jgi:signal transduction histidine kinase
MSPEIARRNVTLLADLNRSPMTICGDSQQLQEVFCNLIDNAIDAMPTGGTLTIHVHPVDGEHTPAQSPGSYAVHIIDTGQGIPRDMMDQIFQPFFTTKKAGRGTGLGLAIAAETIRAHGGTMAVESEPGKGSHFTVTLPMAVRPIAKG